jgi:hypothetical protein
MITQTHTPETCPIDAGGSSILIKSYDRKWCMERMREVAYPAG